jgi:protein-S-isoprenylcysteine O-methyltransferase Ste14
MQVNSGGWRTMVFKNRGALLVPVAFVLLLFGRPSLHTASLGVAIAALGELIRIWAVGYSGETTRADVVTAPVLVTAGPYAIIRNPLYIANAIIALGFWYAFSGGVSRLESFIMLLVVLVLVVGVYAVIIPLEEAYLEGHFGEQYRRYLEAVPRVLPIGGKRAALERRGAWRSEVIMRAEIITLTFFALMVLSVYLKLGPEAAWGVYF